MELEFQGRVGTFQPRLEFKNHDDLSALRGCLNIKASGAHLMMMAQRSLVFYQKDDVVARIEIVASSLLRWADRWNSDAHLKNANILANFLKSRGCASLRENIDRDAEQRKRRQAEDAAWLATWEAAMPSGLAELVEDLCQERYAPEKKALPRALAVLAAQYRSVDEQVLSLLAWYGHSCGPWSGCPVSELAPECILEAFTAAELLHALESQELSSQHPEGAARFVSRWVPKPRRAHLRVLDQFQDSRVRPQIQAHVQSTQDSSKIEAVRRAIG
jgi:hypothetical protein